jgi:hypothetical protein
MAMAEARTDGVERVSQEQSIFQLANVDDNRIIEALSVCQTSGMKSPEAMRQVLSLFKAIPKDTEDPSGLLNPDTDQPETQCDQVGWACENLNALTRAQRDTLKPLIYFDIEALANQPLTRNMEGAEPELSTEVREKAKEVLAAYDAVLAKEFDPDLPQLQFPTGKAARVIATGILALAAACAPIVTPKPTEQSATIPGITQTVDPTETKIPTVTLTPTITNTPTETAVPRPEYYQGFERQANNFPYVQQTDIPLIAKDVLDHPMVTNPVDIGRKPILPLDEFGLEGVVVSCKIGTTCAIRASFRTRDPGGGPDRWYLMWEIRNPGDDHSHVLITYLGGAISGDKDDVQFVLNNIAKITYDGALMELKIGTKLKQGMARFDNPAVNEIVIDVPPADRQTLDTMRSTRTIPDDMSHIVVWLWQEYIL